MDATRITGTDFCGRTVTLADGRQVRVLARAERWTRTRGPRSRLASEVVWRVEAIGSGDRFVVRTPDLQEASGADPSDDAPPSGGGLHALVDVDPGPVTTTRPPDRRWTRPDWAVVEVWLVDLGRPWGARLDWRLNGAEKEPVHFGHPDLAAEHLARWEAQETVPRPAPAPGRTAVLRSGRRVQLMERRIRRVSGRTSAYWRVTPLAGEDFLSGQRPFWVPELEILDRVEAAAAAAHQMKSGRMRPGRPR